MRVRPLDVLSIRGGSPFAWMDSGSGVRARVELRFLLHPGQRALLRCPARFRTAACGRRWGKTVAGCAEAVASALDSGGDFRALWVAPTHDQADEAVGIIRSALEGKGVFSSWSAVRRRFEFRNGASLFFRSGEIPRNLRGRGWDLVVVDEAAFIPDHVWTEVLRPSLMDREGRGVFLSTPSGARGWFHEMFLKGQDEDRPDYASWRFSSAEGGTVSSREVEALRRSLPERVFRQEVLAEFLAGDGMVFSRIPVGSYELPCRPEGEVVVGADLARLHDFTVLCALDDSGRIVGFKRMNRVDYTSQADIIAAFARRFSAPVYLDATGVGQAVLDLLLERNLDVVPVTFTHDSKRQVIQNLAVALERGEITVPSSLDVMLRELRCFAARAAPAGAVYSAPPGMHDDCVVALALAAWGKRRLASLPPVFEAPSGSLL